MVGPPDSRGDDSAVALPASECSLGICTLRLGRPVLELFVAVREGGRISGTEEVDCVRCGGGKGRAVGGASRFGILGSVVFERSTLTSARGWSEELPNPKCCAKMEPRSSIGVNMLRDLEDRCLGWGGLDVSGFNVCWGSGGGDWRGAGGCGGGC